MEGASGVVSSSVSDQKLYKAIPARQVRNHDFAQGTPHAALTWSMNRERGWRRKEVRMDLETNAAGKHEVLVSGSRGKPLVART
jgi:hypothetical protein